jgi:AraC-like DNA-binding protein
MHKETVSDFYKQHKQAGRAHGQFNIYKREEFACDSTSLPTNRRDFYKISLIVNGEGLVSSAGKSIQICGNAITFMNPLIPYSWEPSSTQQTGYFCLFTEDFVIQDLKKDSLAQSALFKVGGDFVFFPDNESMQALIRIFESMHKEMDSNYSKKHDLVRSYVQIVMHEALKMQPPNAFFKPTNATERICTLFMELLERQFHFDSPNQTIKLKNASAFAHQLNVHTNHLNRALKEVTGKTTSQWIAERSTKEAKALLVNGSLHISEIGYSLGFEHPSNFNSFFKNQTGQTPKAFRIKEAGL